jgi:hypothetical protein
VQSGDNEGMEQPSAQECQAALHRLGWFVSEVPNHDGWNLKAHRQGTSFACFGVDRDQIWREVLQHAIGWDGG